jgi:hypothetical protein
MYPVRGMMRCGNTCACLRGDPRGWAKLRVRNDAKVKNLARGGGLDGNMVIESSQAFCRQYSGGPACLGISMLVGGNTASNELPGSAKAHERSGPLGEPAGGKKESPREAETHEGRDLAQV